MLAVKFGEIRCACVNLSMLSFPPARDAAKYLEEGQPASEGGLAEAQTLDGFEAAVQIGFRIAARSPAQTASVHIVAQNLAQQIMAS